MTKSRHFLSGLATLAILSLIMSTSLMAPLLAGAQGPNLALNKPVTCSPNPQFPCVEAVDGNLGTRWASAQGLDPQWIYVDLGMTTTVTHVILRWETAYGKSYQIQTSSDATNWTTIFSTTTGDGGVDDLTGLSGSGRYIRMYGTIRGTGYGYSLWEFEIYGGSSPTNTPTNTSVPPTNTPTRTNTPVGPTNTPTNTSISPTNTPTNTSVAPSNTPTNTAVAGCGTTNVALSKPATASSVTGGNTAAMAVDGNAGTRWESAQGVDPQWIYVDLGSTQSICRVRLNWETAYGKSYQIQTSNDASSWTNIFSTTTSDGGIDDLTGLSGSGRYVRMNGTVRATQWGYSLWEYEIYTGSGGPTNTPTRTNTPTATFTPTNTPSGPTNTPTRTSTPGGCGTTNLALNRVTSTSSVTGGNVAAFAVDGNTATRWESAQGVDPQWIWIDFGAAATFCHVKLNWEAAYGKSYQIQTSPDAINWTTIYSTTTGDGGIDDLTGLSGSGRYLRMYGTVRATGYGYSLFEFEAYGSGGAPTPTPTLSPTPPGGGAFWGDTSTIPPAQNVLMFKFINRTNGAYPDSQVYWSFNGQVHSIAEQQYFDMPANSAGRMYFGLGVPPVAGSPNTYWDFIEFTIGPNDFNGNTTRVDAFGLKLAMRLHADDGYDVSVGESPSLFTEDRTVTFQRFVDAMPTEFKSCGQISAPYRIVEPGVCGFNAGGPYATYYDSYVNTMWANNGLTIPKPGPNGSGLGAYPDISAAIFRHVGAQAGTFTSDGHLISQSLWANSSTFYQAAPAMYYAKFWHDNAINGLAYGFPYDDVGGYSSFIAHGNPQYLIVAIGW